MVPTGSKPTSVLARLAGRFGVEPTKMVECLKATAFRGQVSNEQMMALCVVADQYKLNPWTKEIYAFPDKQNGIVPVVGVDGWARIINEHPQFDGVEFADGDGSCTCTLHRKDREHPTTVTEYLAECQRNTGPWQSHPRRMLRHKALIQCARLAFGYAGIYDQDEAERIIDAQAVEVREPVAMPTPAPGQSRLGAKLAQSQAAAARELPSERMGVPQTTPDVDAKVPAAEAEGKPQVADGDAGGNSKASGAQTITGEVEHVAVKEGRGKRGPWTRYGVKLNGEYYNTFHTSIGSTAQEAHANGQQVRIEWAEGQRGGRDIVRMDVLGDASEELPL
jgi:phage recombination protein Bet